MIPSNSKSAAKCSLKSKSNKRRKSKIKWTHFKDGNIKYQNSWFENSKIGSYIRIKTADHAAFYSSARFVLFAASRSKTKIPTIRLKFRSWVYKKFRRDPKWRKYTQDPLISRVLQEEIGRPWRFSANYSTTNFTRDCWSRWSFRLQWPSSSVSSPRTIRCQSKENYCCLREVILKIAQSMEGS